MKLRIDPKKVSFRLDLDELTELLNQGEVRAETPLPEGKLSYKIICLPPGSAPDFQAEKNSFSLYLARDTIEAHKASLPSLQGIQCQFSTRGGDRLDVSLEVNLKKKLKRSLE